MTTKQATKGRKKPAKGSYDVENPVIGLRLPKARVERLERKADEIGGITKTDVIKIALKKYGV